MGQPSRRLRRQLGEPPLSASHPDRHAAARTEPPVPGLAYQVPVAQIGAYRGRPLIVRARRPWTLLDVLDAHDAGDIAYLQLPVTAEGADALLTRAEGLPIELRLDEPTRDFPHLYRYAGLLDSHPLRVAVPVTDGLEPAVRLALSLDLAVRLEPCQPAPAMIEPLARLLDGYLYRTTVGQPVDWFHSLLIGYCHGEPVDLWSIVEEDPAQCRWVDDAGREHLPGRLRRRPADAQDLAGFIQRFADGLLADGGECVDCPFFAVCRGHFKWPRRDYDCTGIRSLLVVLFQAADALGSDLAAADRATAGTREARPPTSGAV